MEKQVGLSKGENKIELTLDMGNRMQTWSEFHPTLYALNVTLATNEGKDNIITDFGMRDFATEGTQFTTTTVAIPTPRPAPLLPLPTSRVSISRPSCLYGEAFHRTTIA